jgi:predicted protein tyrosine phosphatase
VDITICGHRKAVDLLEASPNQLDIVFISSPDAPYAVESSHKIPKLAKEVCHLLFHDISFPRGKMTPPSREDVQKALDFAKGRDKLIVACQAGISRSSATAYLIQSMEVGMVEALKVLNPQIHHPNSLIVAHGANILGEPDMVDLINKWKNKADESQWGQEWTL